MIFTTFWRFLDKMTENDKKMTRKISTAIDFTTKPAKKRSKKRTRKSKKSGGKSNLQETKK